MAAIDRPARYSTTASRSTKAHPSSPAKAAPTLDLPAPMNPTRSMGPISTGLCHRLAKHNVSILPRLTVEVPAGATTHTEGRCVHGMA